MFLTCSHLFPEALTPSVWASGGVPNISPYWVPNDPDGTTLVLTWIVYLIIIWQIVRRCDLWLDVGG